MRIIIMKKYLYLALFLFLHTCVYSQIHCSDDLCCYVPDRHEPNLRSTGSSFSGNGEDFTPKGDLKILVICAGFGDPYDSSHYYHGWDNAPGALPDMLLDKSTFYSDTADFTTYANANHIKNISRFYYEMSNKKFRLIANVYPQRININAAGASSYSTLNRRVIEKMEQVDPNFNWGQYDSRKNAPLYQEDASVYAPDNKPDYVVIFYRYTPGMPTPGPSFVGWGGGTASSYLSGISKQVYTDYQFDNCGFSVSHSAFYELFVHEVAHTLFDCPHYSYANAIVGKYFYGRYGWGMMNLFGTTPFPCALGWERWYLNWIENIVANNVPADIQNASNLTPSGEYVLRDFVTTGDMIRIKIPNPGGRNQCLWLENHQGISIFDIRNYSIDGCGNPFPQSLKGVTAYIESINDDRDNPGDFTFENGANAVKWFHPKGNFDYVFDFPGSQVCQSYNNMVYNAREVAPDPIGGQSRVEAIRADLNNDNVIYVNTHPNHASPRNEWADIWKRNNVYTYDCMGHEIAFQSGQKLSMSSNPCLTNMPLYQSLSNRMDPFVLNGISVKILSYAPNGNATVKIAYNDVAIENNVRYTGVIHLPNITQNVNPDIIIQPNITLSIDKSGTPNRHTITPVGDFINPTEFHCLAGSFFKQENNSNVVVENGSTLIINGKYEINDGATLRIKAGSGLQIKQGADIQIKDSGTILVENGAYLCVESGANIQLQDYNSIISMQPGAIYGVNLSLFNNISCLSSITFTGFGCVSDYNQDVYIQNETITTNKHYRGRNIYAGRNVTNSKPQGNVVITGGAHVIFDAAGKVIFDTGFKCALGSSFEIRK